MKKITAQSFRIGSLRNIRIVLLISIVSFFTPLKAGVFYPEIFFITTDIDGDGVSDDVDIDDDGDGILDTVEGEEDADGDGVSNRMDIDSDNDGILDNIEAQQVSNFIPPSGNDVDGNGLDDAYEVTPGSGEGLNPLDTDSDTVEDYVDIDSDNDVILDQTEASSIRTDEFDCDTVPNLDFSNNPILESGESNQVGAIYRITNVFENLDALITVEEIVNGEISTLDQNSTDPEFFKPEIVFEFTDDVRRPFVDLRITIVESNTNNEVALEELVANFLDVDGNNAFQEFNRFDRPVSFTVDNPSLVNVNATAGALLINGGSTEFIDITNENPSVNVSVEFADISSFVFRFGVQTGTSDNFSTVIARQSGIQFSCLDNFLDPQTTVFSDDVDTDGDGFPDRLDIDADDDGIPDNVEGQTTAGYIPPSGVDADNDGLDDAYEDGDFEGITPNNHDGTDNPDYIDLDSDNDTVPDNNEGNDFNFDGIPDQTFTGIDTDGDGLDDGYEGSDVNDGFDVNDEIDDPANDLPDTDGTEDVNYRDFDDDGDGIDTPDEDGNGDGDPTNDDEDDDGTPDFLDPDNDDLDEIIVNQYFDLNGTTNSFLFILNVDRVPNNRMRIYNRWGILVYEGTNYNNINNVFNGRSTGRSTLSVNDFLPAGVYYYIFEYESPQGEMITQNDYLYINSN